MGFPDILPRKLLDIFGSEIFTSISYWDLIIEFFGGQKSPIQLVCDDARKVGTLHLLQNKKYPCFLRNTSETSLCFHLYIELSYLNNILFGYNVTWA